MPKKTYEAHYYDLNDECVDCSIEFDDREDAVTEAAKWLVSNPGYAYIICKTRVNTVNRDIKITVK